MMITLYSGDDYKLVCNQNGTLMIYKTGVSKPVYYGGENIQKAISKLMELTGIPVFKLEAIAMAPTGSWRCMEVQQ